MIRFNQGVKGLNNIEIQIINILRDHQMDLVLPRELYVFGAKEGNSNQVYIAPTIPHAKEVAEYIIRKTGFSVVLEEFGNTNRKYWLAIRRDVRLQQVNQANCIRIVLLVALSLNDIIIWN